MTTRIYQRWPAELKARAEAEAARRYQTLTQLTVEALARELERAKREGRR